MRENFFPVILLLGFSYHVHSIESVPPRRGCAPPHDKYPFCDTSLSLSERLDDLISRLTLEEKPFLLTARESPKGNISRLGIPEYDWGANCMHGVQSRCAPDGRCPTSFPNPNTLGSTFNSSLWREMGGVIGLELRALWLQNVGENHESNLPHLGLDCWSPNVGVLRDPRWGRALETASECPHINSIYGIQYTLGLQNNSKVDHRYLQAVATLKHFVANSLEGIDGELQPTRHSVNAKISLYDLASTYLPAFRNTIEQAGAAGIMCSYNRVNGVPMCANEYLLSRVLRRAWSFRGYVTSDSGAIDDFSDYHNYTKHKNESVALAIRAGCDIESSSWTPGQPWSTGGNYIDNIAQLVRDGVLSEAKVDRAIRNALELRFRLGLFDPIDDQPFWKVSPTVVQMEDHVQLAKDATAQGFVLLKNDGNLIPLDPRSKVALIGPHIYDRHVMLGNYLGEICYRDKDNGCVTSFVEGFVSSSNGYGGQINTSQGCEVFGDDTSRFEEAVDIARIADVVVFIGGLNLTMEAEAHDRIDIVFPSIQSQLLHEVSQVNTNIILLLMHGGIAALDNETIDSVRSIVSLGYPGRYAGEVVPEVLYGITERAWGKLAVSWYKSSIMQELNMVDFDMSRPPGRTYRYYTGMVDFEFGHGLNPLTQFDLRDPSFTTFHDQSGVKTTASATIENIGIRGGDEVVMAYLVFRDGVIPSSEPASRLRKQLFGFERIHLAAGESKTVSFNISLKTVQLYDDAGLPVIYPGRYTIQMTTGIKSVSVDIQVFEQIMSGEWRITDGADPDPMILSTG